jgi:hypothetical protein
MRVFGDYRIAAMTNAATSDAIAVTAPKSSKYHPTRHDEWLLLL